MGKFTNLVLIAAATVLIVIGVAAQTGTISIGGHSAHQRGAVAGSQAIASPDPSPSISPPVGAAPTLTGGGEGDGGGHGHGHGGGGGGDGGD